MLSGRDMEVPAQTFYERLSLSSNTSSSRTYACERIFELPPGNHDYTHPRNIVLQNLYTGCYLAGPSASGQVSSSRPSSSINLLRKLVC